MGKDEKWILEHFGELVEQYAGKCVAVVRGRVVAVGSDERMVEERAQARFPRSQPAVLRVPKPKELVCALNFRTQVIVNIKSR